MERKKFTCPFTGVNFDAAVEDGSLIIEHPLTGQKVELPYVAEYNGFFVPYEQFELIETVTSSEAASMLDITRARISQIIANGTIPSYTVNNQHVFKKADIIEYASKRKCGRPQKES